MTESIASKLKLLGLPRIPFKLHACIQEAAGSVTGPVKYLPVRPGSDSIVREGCLKDSLRSYLTNSKSGEFLLARVNSLTIINGELSQVFKEHAGGFEAELVIVDNSCREANLKGEPAAVCALGIKTGQWFGLRAAGPDAAVAIKHFEQLLVKELSLAEVVENTAMREMTFKGRPITGKISISRALVLEDTLDLEAFQVVDLKTEAEKHQRSLDEQLSHNLELMTNAIREMEESLTRDFERAKKTGMADDALMAEAFVCVFAGMSASLLKLMEEKKICAAAAVREFLKAYEANRTSPDPKFQSLYADLHQLCVKLLAIKYKKSINIAEEIDNCKLGGHIMLVAENIAASDSGVLADRRIDGAVREKGAAKEHLSIRLRDHEKAGLTAAAGVTSVVHTGDMVITDGRNGLFIVNPAPETLKRYQVLEAEYDRLDDFLKGQRALPAVTLDGFAVRIVANAASVADVDSIIHRHQLGGVGLVRTEFFFCENPDLSERSEQPTVAEQVDFYSLMVATAGPETEVIFRTIDAEPDTDKVFPYLDLPASRPNGACRKGLGLCLDRVNNGVYYFMFREQLEALAKTKGKFKVMFPLVRTADEFKMAMGLVEEIRSERRAKGKPVNETISFGAMIEHPEIIKDLPAEAEFFSLGTNDLTQYVTKVDRYAALGSQSFDELDPRVLTKIEEAIDQVQAAGKPLGCCGDMPNDWHGMLLLMAMGLDKMSVSTGLSDTARFIIRSVKQSDLRSLLDDLRDKTEEAEKTEKIHYKVKTAREIRHVIEEFTRDKIRSGEWKELEQIEKLLFLDEAA